MPPKRSRPACVEQDARFPYLYITSEEESCAAELAAWRASWATLGNGIEVRQSTIAGAGLGVFATRAFAAGELVTQYAYTALVDATEAKGDYKLSSFGNTGRVFLGVEEPRAGLGGGSFVNDTLDLAASAVATDEDATVAIHYVRTRTPTCEDVAIVTRRQRASMRTEQVAIGQHGVALRALVPIAAGDELFMSYGNAYWTRYVLARVDAIRAAEGIVFPGTLVPTIVSTGFTPNDATLTLPPYLALRPSPGRGLGVFARAQLRAGMDLGQYTGVASTLDDVNDRDEYVVVVHGDDGEYAVSARATEQSPTVAPFVVAAGVVIAAAEQQPTWLRYVNSVDRDADKTNNVVIIHRNNRAFMQTRQRIEPGQELMTYYGHSFFATSSRATATFEVHADGDARSATLALHWGHDWAELLDVYSDDLWCFFFDEQPGDRRRTLVAVLVLHRDGPSTYTLLRVELLPFLIAPENVAKRLIRNLLDYVRSVAPLPARVRVLPALYAQSAAIAHRYSIINDERVLAPYRVLPVDIELLGAFRDTSRSRTSRVERVLDAVQRDAATYAVVQVVDELRLLAFFVVARRQRAIVAFFLADSSLVGVDEAPRVYESTVARILAAAVDGTLVALVLDKNATALANAARMLGFVKRRDAALSILYGDDGDVYKRDEPLSSVLATLSLTDD
jgi:hypothetical protein